jgi:predicted TIM-barrel fold metal-dependent hydrolase
MTTNSPGPGLIDYWCNGFTPKYLSEWTRGLSHSALGLVQRLTPRFVEPDEFIARLDEANVAAVVIPGVKDRVPAGHIPFTDAEPPVDEIVELAEKYPGRIYGMYSLDPGDGMNGVRALEECVRNHGFVAAHIHTHSWDRPLDHRDYYPFYAKCEELGVAVVAQVGHSAAIAPSECGKPMTLDRAAIYFQGVNFVLSHTGWPWVDEALAMVQKHPNCYLGTATYLPKFMPGGVMDYARKRGIGKVMLGTGFPMTTGAELNEQLDASDLSDEAKFGLKEGAARAAFRFE